MPRTRTDQGSASDRTLEQKNRLALVACARTGHRTCEAAPPRKNAWPRNPVDIPLHPNFGIMAQSIECFFAKLTKLRLKHGVYSSVATCKQPSIASASNANKAKPIPFTRTSEPRKMWAQRCDQCVSATARAAAPIQTELNSKNRSLSISQVSQARWVWPLEIFGRNPFKILTYKLWYGTVRINYNQRPSSQK